MELSLYPSTTSTNFTHMKSWLHILISKEEKNKIIMPMQKVMQPFFSHFFSLGNCQIKWHLQRYSNLQHRFTQIQFHPTVGKGERMIHKHESLQKVHTDATVDSWQIHHTSAATLWQYHTPQEGVNHWG